MPPKNAAPNPRSRTLLFKKHRTTVLLSLQPWEAIESAKEKLLLALKSRGSSEIGGASVPEAATDIEFGVPMDRSDLDKGWQPLASDILSRNNQADKKTSTDSITIEAAGLDDGHLVAFRFHNPGPSEVTDGGANKEANGDLGWDVEIPRYADEEI